MSYHTENMNDLVSVIIPAYNASARIKQALESVIAQDYADIEIIVVNDASCDDTGKIAHEVLSRSSSVFRIITHDSNKGECASRNTGIKSAQGKYICFIDADDVVRANFVSCLHAAIVDGQCDISFCGLTDRFTDGKPDKYIRYMQGKSFVARGEKFITLGKIPPSVCCMYSRVFLEESGILFHEGCRAGGDIEFITKAMCRANSVTFTPECLYIYIHHAQMGSVRDNNTREKNLARLKDNSGALSRTAVYLAEHAKSQAVMDMAGKILIPQSVIRSFTLAAMEHDTQLYDTMLHDGNNIEILRRGISLYTLTKKPEVFLKAFMILHMPGIYYRIRSK